MLNTIRQLLTSSSEIEAAFQSLSGYFYFDRRNGGLSVNPAAHLDDNQKKAISSLVDGFKRQLQSGETRLRRGPNGIFVPDMMKISGNGQGVFNLPSDIRSSSSIPLPFPSSCAYGNGGEKRTGGVFVLR